MWHKFYFCPRHISKKEDRKGRTSINFYVSYFMRPFCQKSILEGLQQKIHLAKMENPFRVIHGIQGLLAKRNFETFSRRLTILKNSILQKTSIAFFITFKI